MQELKKGNFISQVPNGTEVRALSWKQPYASLMLLGKVETRVWDANYRGPVLICASKHPYPTSIVNQISGIQTDRIWRDLSRFQENGLSISPSNMPLGHAIGIGWLIDIKDMTYNDQIKSYVEYHPSLFCHFYENVYPIKPFPWKGSQGWKKVSHDDIKRIEII